MITKKFDLYWVLYVFILENFNNNSECFNQFLSDANPFIWEKQSWDPYLFDEFCTKFDKDGSYYENGYSFSLLYIENLDEIYHDVKSVISSMSKQLYIEKTSSIYRNGFDIYAKKYGIQK